MRVNHIEDRIDAQKSYMEFIEKAISKLKSVGTRNITIHQIDIRKQALEETWSKFTLNHEAIKGAMNQIRSHERHRLLQRSYFRENMFDTIHESYLDTLEKMRSLRDQISNNEIRSSLHPSRSLSTGLPTIFGYGPRLPNLELPIFTGSSSEWIQFEDIFNSMVVSNPNLSPFWKLHYLKQSLKGTAAHFIENTTLTTDNFQKAWDSLISFHENKRLLLNSALSSWQNIKRMTKESATEMESLYVTLTLIYRTFETFGRPIHTWDDILVFDSVDRLDNKLVKAWEHHLGSSTEPPTWKQFIEFLKTRLLTLKAVEKSKKPSTQSKNNLCYNCLRQHRVSVCQTTKRCYKCGKKNHSTLHQENLAKKPETSKTESLETDA